MNNPLYRIEEKVLELFMKENFHEATDLCKILYESATKINSSYFQAASQGTMGYILFEEGKYSEAIEKILLTISISTEGYRSFIDTGHLALCYSKLNNLDKALFFVNKAVAAAEKENHLGAQYEWYNFKGNIFFKMKEFEEAHFWVDKSIFIAQKMNKNSNDFFYQSYLTKYEILLQQGQIDQAKILDKQLNSFFNSINDPILHIRRDKLKYLNLYENYLSTNLKL